MRTFAQKQNRPLKLVSSSIARPSNATSGPAHREHPLLHLQRTIGNQAVLRLLQTNAEEFKAGLTGTASPRFAHDLGRIPARPSAAGAIQTKLAVNKPGDICEQEADRVSEQVMRMPEPQLQRACACGGGCSNCQANQPLQTHERLQMKRVQASAPEQSASPSIVQNVLASSGHPIDLSTRVFMEQRFGLDLRQVQVHSDAQAAESARAIDALAYTVAPDIVFGAGQYAPHTTAGRRLLAHELTHIIQRGVGDVIHRRPMPGNIKGQKREASVREMAEQPDYAHQEWKRLTSQERFAVAALMANRYGQDFAKSFLWYTEHPIETFYTAFGPDDVHTPHWFHAQGYKLRMTTVGVTPSHRVQWWVHPSGMRRIQNLDQKSTPQTAKNRQPPETPPPPPPEECKELADMILAILNDEISAATSMKKELEVQKGLLVPMNKLSDDYREQFDAYIQPLEYMKTRLEATVKDLELMRQQLEEMKCPPVPTLDAGLDELSELQIWVDVELSLVDIEFLRPIKTPDVK